MLDLGRSDYPGEFIFTSIPDQPVLILLPALFTLLCCFLIWKLPFIRQSGLPFWLLLLLFLSKAGAGLLNAWIHKHYYDGGDALLYFQQSRVLFSALADHHDLKTYLQLVFAPAYHFPYPSNITPYVTGTDFYDDGGTYLILRFHALLRLVSGGSYLVHIIVFNFLVFTGLLYAYRFLQALNPGLRGIQLLVLFGLPSVFFWSTGILKDGVALAALGFLLYGFSRLCRGPFRIRRVLVVLASAAVIFATRQFMLVMVLPFLLTFFLISRWKKQGWLTVLLVHAGFILFLFLGKYLHPSLDLPARLQAQQEQFFQLIRSETVLPVTPLTPTFLGVIRNVPEALNHALLHPTLTESVSPMQVPFLVENMVVMAALLLLLFFYRPGQFAVSLSLLLSALYMFVIVGIQVTNLGALVRYKMPALLLLMMAIVLSYNSEKINALIQTVKGKS